MKYCEKCGKELLDEAVICPGCGFPVNGNAMQPEAKKVKSGSTVNVKKTVIISVCAFVVALVAATLLLVFKTTDLKIEDIDEVSFIGAIFKYGIPDDMEKTDGGWWSFSYHDRISIEGIELDSVAVYPNPGAYLNNKLVVYNIIEKHKNKPADKLIEKINDKATYLDVALDDNDVTGAFQCDTYYYYYIYKNGRVTISKHIVKNRDFSMIDNYDFEFYFD